MFGLLIETNWLIQGLEVILVQIFSFKILRKPPPNRLSGSDFPNEKKSSVHDLPILS
jgi:hypothetical protein